MLRFTLALVLLSAPASAQDVGGAWKADGDRITLRIAKIGFPMRAGTVALTKTGEFSNKGEALDNFAQFESADRRVFATAYVYLTTYADAALAAYATDLSISARFAMTAPANQRTVAVAGRTDGAIRQVFTGALNGQAKTTAAAFARVGNWIVKLRASGPADRGAEMTAALDALLAGVSADRDALVYPARPLMIGAPCPSGDTPAAKLITDDKTGAAMLLSGLSGGSMIAPRKPATTDLLIAFPANGATQACVRGTMTFGNGHLDLLQPAGAGEPAVALAMIGDAGTVIAVEKLLGFPGYAVKRYTVGRVEVGARIDRQPTAAQLAHWLATPDTPELRLSLTTTVKADGTTRINVNAATFK